MRKHRVTASRPKVARLPVAVARTTPSAQDLISRLRELLLLADKAFKDSSRPSFSQELVEIPEIVSKLQTVIGKKSARRVPFWKCVVALDHALPGLVLVATLDALVKRACALPPGPLVQLLKLKAAGKLKPAECAVVDEMQAKPDYKFDELPPDPAKWGTVAERVESKAFSDSAANARLRWPITIRPPELVQFLPFTAYRDFVLEHKNWLDHFLPSLEPFVLLLEYLQNEDYDRSRNSILFGYVRKAKKMKKRHARDLANLRQKKYAKSSAHKRSAPRRKRSKGQTRAKKLPLKSS